MAETEMPAKKLLLRSRKILVVFFGDAKVQLGESSLRHGTAQNAKDWKVGPSVERASNSSAGVRHSQTSKFTIDAKPACSRRSLLVGMLRAEEAATRLGDITREQTENAIVAIIGDDGPFNLTNAFNSNAVGESTEDSRLFVRRNRCHKVGEIMGDTAGGSRIDQERVNGVRCGKGARYLGQDFTGDIKADLANIGFRKRKAGRFQGARDLEQGLSGWI
jgi:hypothetical protein